MSGLPGAGPAPPRFAEAVEAIERALVGLEDRGVGCEAQTAALLAVLLPRLVALHGPHAVAAVFGRLAAAVADHAGASGRA